MALITDTLKIISSEEQTQTRRSWVGTIYTRTYERTVYQQHCDPGTALTSIGSGTTEVETRYTYDGGCYAIMQTTYEDKTDWST